MQTISTKKLLSKTYKTVGFGGRWFASFGDVEVGSRWIIYGEPGNGKTELCVQLTAELCRQGFSVFYVSAEQADKSSIQHPWRRNVSSSKAYLIKDATIQEIEEKLLAKRGKKKAVIIDSLDYVDITEKEYKQWDAYGVLMVFVCWADGNKPMTTLAKKVWYMVDVKIKVKKFRAFPTSRYGGNEPFTIYEEEAKKHHHDLNK